MLFAPRFTSVWNTCCPFVEGLTERNEAGFGVFVLVAV